jgi:hypothetical protein
VAGEGGESNDVLVLTGLVNLEEHVGKPSPERCVRSIDDAQGVRGREHPHGVFDLRRACLDRDQPRPER